MLAILSTLKKWASKRQTLKNRKAIIKKRGSHKLNIQTKENNGSPPKKLLIDVSIISRNDAGTGIQRVVRALFKELIIKNPSEYSIHPIAATLKKQYKYITWAGIAAPRNTEITINSGDIFLGLDLCTRIIPANYKQLTKWKEQGGNIYFIVYDILPILNPNWFPIKMQTRFRNWLKSISILADATICISPHTRQDLQIWIKDHYGITPEYLPSHIIPMGSNIEATIPSKGLPSNFSATITKIKFNKSALIVGTLEPRKGHNQILDAFEALWEKKSDALLVIVGRPGWKTEELQSRLINHRENNIRLFWINNASDEALLEIYKASTGLIIASLGEGFGLPIIEAQALNKPILARDLPVFRYMDHRNIEFFTAIESKDLADQIDNWLNKSIKNTFENPINNKHTTTQQQKTSPKWSDSVNVLLKHLKSESIDQSNSTLIGSQGNLEPCTTKNEK